VWADAAFGAVRRLPLTLSPEDSRMESAPSTAPLHRYVSLFSEHAGATLYSDGLAEYEATPGGDILITVLRAVGELSRNDLTERPGHAGWPAHTPGAQSHGPFSARLALMFHGARTPEAVDAIERTADDVMLPLVGETLRSALAIPPVTSGVELRGAGLALSAIKESEDGEWLVVRCVNLLQHDVTGTWRFGFPVTEARLARLDEMPAETIPISENGVTFRSAARAIVTILVR
jgi:alpha-mannosidase